MEAAATTGIRGGCSHHRGFEPSPGTQGLVLRGTGDGGFSISCSGAWYRWSNSARALSGDAIAVHHDRDLAAILLKSPLSIEAPPETHPQAVGPSAPTEMRARRAPSPRLADAERQHHMGRPTSRTRWAAARWPGDGWLAARDDQSRRNSVPNRRAHLPEVMRRSGFSSEVRGGDRAGALHLLDRCRSVQLEAAAEPSLQTRSPDGCLDREEGADGEDKRWFAGFLG